MNFIPSGRCRMDPSVPCCVVSCYTQCPGRCGPSKQETAVSLLGQDCSIIANMHILIIFRGVWAFYTVFWHRFWSGMHPICCSGIRHLAETPLLISININYELKQCTLCQIPLPLLKSRIEMVLPLLLLTSAASSAVGRHLMGANMM